MRGLLLLCVFVLPAFAGDVDRLIGAGADVNGKAEDGVTPLIMTAFEGHSPVARVLLAAGAEVSAQRDDGTTALASIEIFTERGVGTIIRGE